MMLGEALPLTGVPEGCQARPRLVADESDGWRLPRDRSRRTKITKVELVAADVSKHSPPQLEVRDKNFIYGAVRRRWDTVTNHYGSAEAAWRAALQLVRVGLVRIRCDVVDGTRIGAPSSWQLTDSALATRTSRGQRPTVAAEIARAMLAKAGLVDEEWIDTWLSSAKRAGLLSQAGSAELAKCAARCLTALPVITGGPPIARNVLAATRTGARGAHGLDDGHRLTAFVLRGVAAMCDTEYPRTPAGRRALWAEVGVLSDEISTTVLIANLRPIGENLVARQLRERSESGFPSHLCASDLASVSIRLEEPAPVFICENPRVIEAALVAGIKVPLICTAGNPTTVTLRLLDQLAEAGCRFAYRGDFDWPGLAIANRVIRHLGCETWLFDAAVYERIVQTTGLHER